MPTSDALERTLALIALGDRKAFSALYDATSAKLFGVCLRILKDRATAEDALQESFMKVWRYADRYTPEGASPMTWMISIARNTAIDKLRAARPTEDVTELAEVLPSSDPTPEQAALAGAQLGQITACLNQLDDPRDRAVRGAYLEGLSYAELADSLQVPLNTIRTWLRRSLIALRECMGQ